jgi:outer membrane protein
MKSVSLFVLISILVPAALLAQAPAAAPAGTKVAVIDMQRAIVENAEGKKAQDQFVAEVTKRQGDFDKKQKALDEAQTKLRTQDKALSDAAKAELTKQIDQLTTEMNRMNEDAQKDLGTMQQDLLRPIADRTQRVLNAYAQESGLSVVFDVSNQASPIVYVSDLTDITSEIIRRVDAEAGKAPAATKPATPPKP